MVDFKFADIEVDEVYDTVGLDGHIRLWRAVIDQAIDDAIRHARLARTHRIAPLSDKYQAELLKDLQYLRAVPIPDEDYDEETPGIIQVCAMARIPYDIMRRKCAMILAEEGIEL